MASNQMIAIAWLKKNLWDRLDYPEKYTVENVLNDVQSRIENLARSPPSISDDNQSYQIWQLAEKDLYDVPTGLKDSLNELSYVMGSSAKNEAYTRCRINSILISCIAAERRLAEDIQRDSSPAVSQPPQMIELERSVTPRGAMALHLQLETPLKYLVWYKGRARMLTGLADYSLWYDEIDMGTKFVVVEAKRLGNSESARSQCLAYTGIVHTIRKTAQRMHKVVYGICTDSTNYQFLRIDNKSIVTESQPFRWGPDIVNNTIISYIRYIVRAALHSSPRTSPVKPVMQRETILEAFNTRVEFGYGLQNPRLGDNSSEDGEDDDLKQYEEAGELVEMSDIEE